MSFHRLDYLVDIGFSLIILRHKVVYLGLSLLEQSQEAALLILFRRESAKLGYKARKHITDLAHVLGTYVIKCSL